MPNVTSLNTVTLARPIKVDGKDVTEITLRKPSTGEMRGLSLMDILRMDVDAMIRLLPRITVPPLSELQLAREIEPEDFTDLASKTVLFFAKMDQLEGAFLEMKANV